MDVLERVLGNILVRVYVPILALVLLIVLGCLLDFIIALVVLVAHAATPCACLFFCSVDLRHLRLLFLFFLLLFLLLVHACKTFLKNLDRCKLQLLWCNVVLLTSKLCNQHAPLQLAISPIRLCFIVSTNKIENGFQKSVDASQLAWTGQYFGLGSHFVDPS